MTSGKQEFGYFAADDIGSYYTRYGFPIWAPARLPIALNGGAIF